MEKKIVVLSVDASAYDRVMGMIGLCNGIEVMETGDMVENRSLNDICVAEAIAELRNDKRVYKRPSDLAYVMLGVNDGAVKGLDLYLKPDDYLGYLVQLGIKGLPSRSTLYNKMNTTIGKYPEWTFVDNVKPKEALRRKNNVSRFSSAYIRAKRRILDSILDK
jgi:hypothetical protein